MFVDIKAEPKEVINSKKRNGKKQCHCLCMWNECFIVFFDEMNFQFDNNCISNSVSQFHKKFEEPLVPEGKNLYLGKQLF